MPRGREPSWAMKQVIWDLYAKQGGRPEVIRRDIDSLTWTDERLENESTPDGRTIMRVIDELQALPGAIVRLLPPHVQEKRNDWPAIQRQPEKPLETPLIVAMREVGSPVSIPAKNTSGRLIDFLLANASTNPIVMEGIDMVVLRREAVDTGPTIGAPLVTYRYEVDLRPGVDEYTVTKKVYKYPPGDVDEFKVVCTSQDGVKYNMRLDFHCYDLAARKNFISHSPDFDIVFPKKGGRRPSLILKT